MDPFSVRMGNMEKGLAALSKDVAKIKDTLKNVSGSPPIIKGYANAEFRLNDRLDVLELRKELRALGDSIQKAVDSIAGVFAAVADAVRKNGEDMQALREELEAAKKELQETIDGLQEAIDAMGAGDLDVTESGGEEPE